MNTIRPGDTSPDHPCPDCGGPMTLVAAPCPNERAVCGVAHYEFACLPCRRRRWDEHDRPATIGELKELAARIDRLIEAAEAR